MPSLYTGLEWKKGQQSMLEAIGTATPHQYRLAESGDSIGAYAGFSEQKSWIKLGQFEDPVLAMIACERHDFAYAINMPNARRDDLIFVGSARTRERVALLIDQGAGDVLDMLLDTPTVDDGRPFFRAASYFEGQKSNIKQDKQGNLFLEFKIPSTEVPRWLIDVAPGSIVALGAVLETNQVDMEQVEWRKRGAQAFARSLLLTQDPLFAEWLEGRYDRWRLICQTRQEKNHTTDDIERAVAETLRRILGVTKRSKIVGSPDAIQTLESLDQEFYRDLKAGFGIYTGKS